MHSACTAYTRALFHCLTSKMVVNDVVGSPSIGSGYDAGKTPLAIVSNQQMALEWLMKTEPEGLMKTKPDLK